MIKGINKIPIKRYGLIIILIVILFSGSFYLYLHYHRAQRLQNNIAKLITSRENSAMIDSCLLNLYNADNNSRLYAVTGDKIYLTRFDIEIKRVSRILEEIKIEKRHIEALSPERLRLLVNQKVYKTEDYLQTRKETDSLIKSTIKNDSALAYSKVKVPVPVTQTVKRIVHVDTMRVKDILRNAAIAPKKKFLGRVFSVFDSKKKKERRKEQEASAARTAAPLLIKTDTVIQTTVKAKSMLARMPKKQRGYYRRLYAANSSLKKNEHAILLINNSLLSQMIAALKQYKDAEMAYAKESKNELAGRVTDVFAEYNILSRVTIGALIVLLITLFYNIWKIFMNERDIIDYSEKAEQYAIAKSKFMAAMSHEIRTPLNSVIGFSEQLSMDRLTPGQTEQVNAIRTSSRMLLDVVNEILDFSKYETGRMNFEQQPFRVVQALEDVFSSVTIQANRKGISLKKELLIDSDLCFSGDVLRLKQVVMNLMVNALKFTARGEVFLQASVIPVSKTSATLKVRIKDSGIGIKKQDIPLIFDEFAQVNDAQKVTHHKGTGLGLAICKKIVELQGGRIKVISEVGKGSLFSFELPFVISETDVCEVETLSNEELTHSVSGKHVLLAEDNQLNVLLAKTILKKWNITCDVALNGQEAAQLFDQHHYDLVLTDIQMPVMDGLELMKVIRSDKNSLKAETPLIALTANVLKEDRDIYKQTGANDIVLKPFVEHDLIEKIAAVLRKSETTAGSYLLRYV